jgi:hypothetical protein
VQYAKDRDMATGLVFLFGIGIPLCSGLIVKLMQETTFNGDLAQARLLFYFLTGGFGQKWWFWVCGSWPVSTSRSSNPGTSQSFGD